MSEDSTAELRADEGRPNVSRRSFLAGGLAGVVGSALARLPAAKAQSLVEGEPLLLGQQNVAEQVTGLKIPDGIAGPALRVENPEGPAIEAFGGPKSPGVVTNAVMAGGGTYTSTLTANNVAITGTLVAETAEFRDSRVTALMADTAMFSQSRVSGPLLAESAVITQTVLGIPAIQGTGWPGVVGAPNLGPVTITPTGNPPVGVWGTTLPLSFTNPDSPPVGVFAQAGPGQVALRSLNPRGIALEVDGRIVVSSAGHGIVPAGERTVEIEDSQIRESCHLSLTLTGDTGNRGATLHYVEVGNGKAVVHLVANAKEETPFTWLCLEIAD